MRVMAVILSAIITVSACAPTTTAQSTPTLYVYRLNPSAFLELDSTWHVTRELPFAIPQGCDLGGVHPAPRGPNLAVELNCAFGPAMLWLDVRSGLVRQPVTDANSHYLAWAPDGQAIYLKLDTINRPRIVRFRLNGGVEPLPIDELTYDLAPAPSGDALVYALSRGMGRGSEMWLSSVDGLSMSQLVADARSYMALASWSPDSKRLAFIKIPDSSVPFTIGELWIMGADGNDARRLSDADAGHGFAPAWSPDGTRIAYVMRENPGDPTANTSSNALVSNLGLVEVQNGAARRITDFDAARIEAPVWKPHADVIFFNARVDDRMAVYVLDLTEGSVQSIPIASICCAAWLEQ